MVCRRWWVAFSSDVLSDMLWKIEQCGQNVVVINEENRRC